MYNINMPTFKYVQLEEFLVILKNFRIAIDGTGIELALEKLTTYIRCYVGRL